MIEKVIEQLQSHCLYQAANWLSLLDYYSLEPLDIHEYAKEDLVSGEERKLHTLAKTMMDCRDYGNISHLLRNAKLPSLLFLKFYSSYLVIERRFSQSQTLFENVPSHPHHEKYTALLQELLKNISNSSKNGDPFMLYLQGIICNRLKLMKQCIEALVSSINSFPYNWSAWTELLSCIKTQKDFQQIQKRLPHCPPYFFFLALYAIEFQHDDTETVKLLHTLRESFPNHPSIKLMLATCHYHRREFEFSKAIFEEYYEDEPSSLEGVDVYSNVLFLTGDISMLSILAQKCTELDKYTPETCCVIANFYGLKGQHEKAIMYFKRALKLDKNYLPAWTLMGHEYLEIGNTKAALESYRRAVARVDYDSRDYRAWYGLGQAYEILGLYSFALLYYQKALCIRSKDVRLWSAVAAVYETQGMQNEAMLCYQKATAKYMPTTKAMNVDGVEENEDFIQCLKVWLKIGKLLEGSNQVDKSIFWFESALKYEHCRNEIPENDWNEALLLLGKYYLKQGKPRRAEKFLFQLINQSEGPENEEAKALLSGSKLLQ